MKMQVSQMYNILCNEYRQCKVWFYSVTPYINVLSVCVLICVETLQFYFFLMRCFDSLVYFVEYSICQHYLITENNMLENKIKEPAPDIL